MRVLSVLVAALLGSRGAALAEPPDPRPPARFRDIGGRSGKLLAFIETREGLAELERAGLRVTIEEPGVYPFEWPPGLAAGPYEGRRERHPAHAVLGRSATAASGTTFWGAGRTRAAAAESSPAAKRSGVCRREGRVRACRPGSSR